MSTKTVSPVAAERPAVSLRHADLHEAMQRARALRALWLKSQFRRLFAWIRARLHVPTVRTAAHAR